MPGGGDSLAALESEETDGTPNSASRDRVALGKLPSLSELQFPNFKNK